MESIQMATQLLSAKRLVMPQSGRKRLANIPLLVIAWVSCIVPASAVAGETSRWDPLSSRVKQGQLGGLAVYRRALTAEEISKIHRR
jgi:hypothetical protein